MGNGSRLFRSRKVTGVGEGVTSRAGLVLVSEVIEGTGLAGGFRDSFAGWSRRRHNPGDGFAQVVVGLADGAKAMTDITSVAANCGLYHRSASNSTMAEWFCRVGSVELAGIARARSTARAKAWEAGAGPSGSTLIVDIDSTLIRAADTKH